MFESIDAAEKNLQRQLDFIAKSDHKLEIIFPGLILLSGLIGYSCLNVWSEFTYIRPFISFSVVFWSISITYWTIASSPRLGNKGNSLIYFDHISQGNADLFLERWKKLDEQHYLNEILLQTHLNSEISSIRYRLLKKVILTGYISAVSMATGLFFYAMVS